MPAPRTTLAGAAGNILLVEEYSALSIAIAVALQNFAPGYTTRAAQSLAEAAQLAHSLRPELVVLDLDPPPLGVLEFVERMRELLPDARLLLLVAQAQSDLLREFSRTSALQLLAKPFELPRFGSVLGTLLPTTGGSPAHRRKTLRGIGLSEVLCLQCLAGVTGIVRVEKSKRRAGEIHLLYGKMVHATAFGCSGAEALREMLRWHAPQLQVAEEQPGLLRTLQGSWQTVLAAALAATNDHDVPEEALPTAGKPTPPARTGRKIVIIDDTELLLIFVEEILSTFDPTLQIATASGGEAGVRQVCATLPDLVLLDYSLPDLNGDEVCQRLLQDERTAQIPVVMMSGHVPEMEAAAERLQNIAATLPKPFLSPALLRVVKQTLAQPWRPASAKPEPPPLAPEAPPAVAEAPAAAPRRAPRANGHGNGKSLAKASPQPSAPASALPKISAPPATLLKVAAPQEPPPPPPAPPPQAPPVAPVSPPAHPSPIEVVPAPPPIFAGLAPARIPVARANHVVLGLPLEVLSIRFSPALQMAAIRARPYSPTVSLHVDPQVLPGTTLPEAGFELAHVDLGPRGQIQTLRLAPTVQEIAVLQPRNTFPVGDVTVLPANGGRALELVPAAVTPMRMQLLASFELAGVELSATFGIASLVLRSRADRMRVTLQPEAAQSGATFETAQVLLDHSGRIAEILLDAVA